MMVFNLKKRIASLLLATSVLGTAFAAMPVFAADNIEIVFEDVTETDPTIQQGEAKIKVSVKGADGDVSIAQVRVSFDGDLEYKDVEFAKDFKNLNMNDGAAVAPDEPTKANSLKKILTSVLSVKKPFEFDGETELFTLIFSGEPGESVSVTLDKENTYCQMGNDKIYSLASNSATATATEEGKEGVDAVVKVRMDKVPGFSVGNNTDAGSVITLTLTNEETGHSFSRTLNSSNKDDSFTATAFKVEENILKGSYTVELSGLGFVTYKKTGVTFDKELSITNAEFIPGDINKDEVVDSKDKAIYKVLLNDEYPEDYERFEEAADINRDGKVSSLDNVFEDIEDEVIEEPGDDEGENNGDDNGSGDGNGNGGNGNGGNNSGSNSGGNNNGGGGNAGIGGAPVGGGAVVGFVDLGNHGWAEDAIYTLKNRGIINGISATEFAPEANIKRGDFILILTRMLGVNNEFTENFADVPIGSYYYNAIGSAKAAGIATGDGTNFMPEDSITRQDLITLAYRAFESAGYITATEDTTSLDAFGDKDMIDDYAVSAMASMVKQGIIQGADGNVNPKGNATRAEVAVMCERLLRLM